MPTRSLTTDQLLTILAQTPLRIVDLTAGVGPAQLHASPGAGGWSANDVLAHLRSCADVWGSYIELIITQDRPTIRAVNPTTWINSTDYPRQDFQLSLRTFVQQRAGLLAVLEPLAPELWLRAATVTGSGKPRERTVMFYAQWLARHERTHLKQIARIVNIVNADRV